MKQYKIRLNKKSINQYTYTSVHNLHTLPKLVSPLFGKILMEQTSEQCPSRIPDRDGAGLVLTTFLHTAPKLVDLLIWGRTNFYPIRS